MRSSPPFLVFLGVILASVQSCRKILRDIPVKTAFFLEGCLGAGLRDGPWRRSGAWAEGEPTGFCLHPEQGLSGSQRQVRPVHWSGCWKGRR